jgi:hypothetical protein
MQETTELEAGELLVYAGTFEGPYYEWFSTEKAQASSLLNLGAAATTGTRGPAQHSVCSM